MKRYTLVFVVFILVISIFIIIIQANQPENSTITVLQKAFDATGAEVASSEVYMRGELAAGSFKSAHERQQLLSDIIEGAGGETEEAKPAFFSVDSDINYGTETDYIINDSRNIKISILKDGKDEQAENYHLTVSLTDTSQQQELTEPMAGLMGVMEKYNIKPAVNIRITGSLDGNLEAGELEKVCQEVFDAAGADRVEGMKDNGLVSVSAFSPSIHDAVRVNGKRVNLNVAVRYNSYEGKTYIWLATPVITTEY